jgi:hypothetical protein
VRNSKCVLPLDTDHVQIPQSSRNPPFFHTCFPNLPVFIQNPPRTHQYVLLLHKNAYEVSKSFSSSSPTPPSKVIMLCPSPKLMCYTKMFTCRRNVLKRPTNALICAFPRSLQQRLYISPLLTSNSPRINTPVFSLIHRFHTTSILILGCLSK